MLTPPTWAHTARELLVGRDVVRLALRAPWLRGLPRGDGDPVVLVPGLGATDLSFLPLRGLLSRLGHDVRTAGLGRVSSDVATLAARVTDAASSVRDETGRKVALVGWSLGGVLAREVAREAPDAIRRVVTMGTPVVGGPSFTALARGYSTRQLAGIRAAIAVRDRVPILVPITALWSRNDGIVAGRACIDRTSPHVENIEVTSTHLGMGVDPDVWTIVAGRLART